MNSLPRLVGAEIEKETSSGSKILTVTNPSSSGSDREVKYLDPDNMIIGSGSYQSGQPAPNWINFSDNNSNNPARRIKIESPYCTIDRGGDTWLTVDGINNKIDMDAYNIDMDAETQLKLSSLNISIDATNLKLGSSSKRCKTTFNDEITIEYNQYSHTTNLIGPSITTKELDVHDSVSLGNNIGYIDSDFNNDPCDIQVRGQFKVVPSLLAASASYSSSDIPYMAYEIIPINLESKNYRGKLASQFGYTSAKLYTVPNPYYYNGNALGNAIDYNIQEVSLTCTDTSYNATCYLIDARGFSDYRWEIYAFKNTERYPDDSNWHYRQTNQALLYAVYYNGEEPSLSAIYNWNDNHKFAAFFSEFHLTKDYVKVCNEECHLRKSWKEILT